MTIPQSIALVALLVFVVRLPSAAAASSSVPTFDTRPTCADAATEISITRTVERCQQSEKQARDSLASQWDGFPTKDRTDCSATTRIGGFPSYVQLLTCLELARDARTLHLD
jgi:hypothetical protein